MSRFWHGSHIRLDLARLDELLAVYVELEGAGNGVRLQCQLLLVRVDLDVNAPPDDGRMILREVIGEAAFRVDGEPFGIVEAGLGIRGIVAGLDEPGDSDLDRFLEAGGIERLCNRAGCRPRSRLGVERGCTADKKNTQEGGKKRGMAAGHGVQQPPVDCVLPYHCPGGGCQKESIGRGRKLIREITYSRGLSACSR